MEQFYPQKLQDFTFIIVIIYKVRFALKIEICSVPGQLIFAGLFLSHCVNYHKLALSKKDMKTP